ncbi:MAG: hypothetical protein A2017_02255 [Lentisphaerae bacterium GWF2_44_16]|nr:MAG: hypothetical protein A2017_02255 [Lentisphaerae bacterium GWF2_44_16]
MQVTVEKIDVNTVLIDVDGTITGKKEDAGIINPLEHLLNLVMEKKGVSQKEALQEISEAGNPETTCLFNLLRTLDVSREELWERLRNDVVKNIEIPEDASFFIKSLREKKIKLYSATTNSRMITLLKLSAGGLGDINGSPYFAGYFGGDAFNDPQGKYSEKFFPSILKHGNFDPEKTMMVGDNEKCDLLPALKSGIRSVVIINRKQKESLIYKNGGIYVNSLRILCDMI